MYVVPLAVVLIRTLPSGENSRSTTGALCWSVRIGRPSRVNNRTVRPRLPRARHARGGGPLPGGGREDARSPVAVGGHDSGRGRVVGRGGHGSPAGVEDP